MAKPEKKNLLYVDDSKEWTFTAKLILEDTDYNLISFNDLPEAKQYWKENSETLSLVICDGSINETNDGRRWANELHIAGHKAMILSGDDTLGKVPALYKGKFNSETFLAAIKKAIGRKKG